MSPQKTLSEADQAMLITKALELTAEARALQERGVAISAERRAVLRRLCLGGMSYARIGEVLGFDATRVAEIIWGNRKTKKRQAQNGI
jgi:DNA-directed RNA polymerase specialized sigma24 family protein